jgi:sec-independent protein translocase protein TatB
VISYHVPVIEGMEFIVILLVALVVLGPQRLPEMARKMGNWTSEMRRAAAELRQGLEAEVGDVREIARDIREPLREVTETVRETKQVINEEVAPKTWVGPKPLSGPTPEDAMADLERINAGEPLDDTTATPDIDQEQGPDAAIGGGRGTKKANHDVEAPGAWVGPKQLSGPPPEDPPGMASGAGTEPEEDAPRAEGGAA